MDAFLGVFLFVASLFISSSDGSTLMFAFKEYYSELSAEGHVYIGRHANPLDLSSVADDPRGIMIKLLNARFLDKQGNRLHEVDIGDIPELYDDYYFYGEKREEKKVLFDLYPFEMEEYRHLSALGRKMTAVFREANVRLTLSVYIFMKTGVLDLHTDIEDTVHRGNVRLDLEFTRTDPCPACDQVAGVELDVWIRGQGPVRKNGNLRYTRYNMGSRSQISIPHKAIKSNDLLTSVDAASNGEGRIVNLTLKSELPTDSSDSLLYCLTFCTAELPAVSDPSEDNYNYMDQEPNGAPDSGREEQEDDNKIRETKDAQLSAASSIQLSAVFVTFILAHMHITRNREW